MKLITELNESVKFKLVEDTRGEKQLFVEGIFIQGDIENKNGRVYPMEILKPEVERYIKEKVNTNRAWGELGHPDGPEINADRISHRITELKLDGTDYIGKALVIKESHCGGIAHALISTGGSLAMSTRAIGSLQERNGINYVQEDFTLFTAGDFVIDPSAPEAFVNGIMEGKEWILREGKLIEKLIDTTKKQINQTINENKFDITKRNIKLANLLNGFLRNL